MPAPRLIRCIALLSLAACGASRAFELADPGQPTADQRAALVAAETCYRKGQPFDELRRRIAGDPVTAWWFTRMVVRDLMAVREGQLTTLEQRNAPVRALPEFIAAGRKSEPADSEPLLRASAGQRNPIEVRALAEIDALGAAAVACVVRDLGCHPQSYVRQIGVELLGRIGAPARPAVERDLVAATDPVQRRTGVQALAAMPRDAELDERLRALGADPHHGVRAAAFDGLATAGADAAPVLRRAVDGDPDPLARRAAARALGFHRQAANAQALVGFLARCQQERDAAGADIAQAALQQLARSRGLRSIDAWRQWAAQWRPENGG